MLGVAIRSAPGRGFHVIHTGCRGPRIVFARIRASPCNLFVVCVYIPHSGRQSPSAADTMYELEDLLNSARLHDCVIVLGDFNAKLPRRHDTNATYLSKDRRYGPSQIDYILASRRWSTSAHKTRVKWGVSFQRWGRHYDHGMMTCD